MKFSGLNWKSKGWITVIKYIKLIIKIVTYNTITNKFDYQNDWHDHPLIDSDLHGLIQWSNRIQIKFDLIGIFIDDQSHQFSRRRSNIKKG